MLHLLAVLAGPIFAKEAVEIARRKRYYLNRVLYGAALLTALFIVWEEHYYRLHRSGGGARIQAMARMAEDLFLAVNIIQFGAVFLFVPLFTCGVLAGEREKKTLDLLFTTQLRDRDIVLGKLLSRLATLMILILCGLPMFGLVMLQGGVDPNALLRTTATTLLATLFVGAHAIYFSAISRSHLGALVRTYWWLTIILGAIPGALFVPVVATTPGPSHPVAVVYLGGLFLTNPIALFTVGLETSLYNRVVAIGGSWAFVAGFALPGLWSLFLIWRAICRVREDAIAFRVPALSERWRSTLMNTTTRFGKRWDSLWQGIFAYRWQLGAVSNPLWMRALQARVYDRDGYIGRIQWGGWLVAFVALGLLIACEPQDIDDEEVSMSFLAVTWGAIAALTALLAGAGLSGDRSRGFLDLMLATPMTGRTIIDGTMLALWEHLRRVYWLPWLLMLFFCLTGASLIYGALFSGITVTLFLVLMVLNAVGCSLTARTVPTALLATFVFPLAVNLAPLVPVGILEEEHALLLWPLCVWGAGASFVWFRYRPGVAALTVFLTMAHLTLASLATCWTYDGRRDEFPVAAMNPSFLTIIMLDDRFEREFRHVDWLLLYPVYWSMLIVNILFVRWWLIRNFDRLVGRIPSR